MRTATGLESISNFRDVAITVNGRQSRSILRSGQLYRSARPDEASQQDRDALSKHYGIRTIIDLRTTTELINAAKKHSSSVGHTSSAAVPTDNQALLTPLRIDGIDYAAINVSGKGFERHLLWQLSYLSLARLIWLMVLGYRMEAIGILGREVLKPRGLIGLATDTIDHSQQEIRQFFVKANEEAAWPVLVHCTQGKDRTGLMVMLLLLLCDIDIDAITYDYVLSEAELAEEFDERMKEISSIGLDESFASCPADLVPRVQEHIVQRYGSVNHYLQHIGVTELQRQSIRRRLLLDTKEVDQP